MTTNKTTLNDEELSSVTGGVKTGDMKDGKVYIKFPLFLSSMSGYYGCDEVEALANQYIGFKSAIQPYITKDMIDAVKNLYEVNKRAMPIVVSQFFS